MTEPPSAGHVPWNTRTINDWLGQQLAIIEESKVLSADDTSQWLTYLSLVTQVALLTDIQKLQSMFAEARMPPPQRTGW